MVAMFFSGYGPPFGLSERAGWDWKRGPMCLRNLLF